MTDTTDMTELKANPMETQSALPPEETERLTKDIVASLKTVFDPELQALQRAKGVQKTLDAGQLAVSAYLIARQEILTSRREYLDRLLALACTLLERQELFDPHHQRRQAVAA